jgi:hypothetical protein
VVRDAAKTPLLTMRVRDGRRGRVLTMRVSYLIQSVSNLILRSGVFAASRRMWPLTRVVGHFAAPRHCEERSDEAIQTADAAGFWIASLTLAMTEN